MLAFDINVLDEFLQTVNGLEEFVSKFANQVLEINHENETANNLQPSAEGELGNKMMQNVNKSINEKIITGDENSFAVFFNLFIYLINPATYWH